MVMKKILLVLSLLTIASCEAAPGIGGGTITGGAGGSSSGGVNPIGNGSALTNVNVNNLTLPVTNIVYDATVAYSTGLGTIQDALGNTIDISAYNNKQWFVFQTQPLILTNTVSPKAYFFWSTNDFTIGGPGWVMFTNLDVSANDWISAAEAIAVLGTNGNIPALSTWNDGASTIYTNLFQFKTNVTVANVKVASQDVWVDATYGNDLFGVRGLQEFPYKTISAAMVVGPSNTIHVTSGNYTESPVLSAGTKLLGNGRGNTFIAGKLTVNSNNVNIENLSCQVVYLGGSLRASNTVFVNVDTIGTNWGDGIFVAGKYQLTATSCKLSSSWDVWADFSNLGGTGIGDYTNSTADFYDCSFISDDALGGTTGQEAFVLGPGKIRVFGGHVIHRHTLGSVNAAIVSLANSAATNGACEFWGTTFEYTNSNGSFPATFISNPSGTSIKVNGGSGWLKSDVSDSLSHVTYAPQEGSIFTNLNASSLMSGTVAAARLPNSVSISTNTSNFRFTPALPGQWITGLATRATNTAQRATLELDLGFVDAATGTPVALVTIEYGTQKTNVWTCAAPGTIVSTVTNHYPFKLSPGAVVIVTDVSRGTGASVTLSQSQITSE